MPSSRWSVKSLRRFTDIEILINTYIAIGGVLSFVYIAMAIWNTKIVTHILSPQLLQNGPVILRILIQIILQAILRTIFWLPQAIYVLLTGHQSLWDWAIAANILKELS